MPQGHLSKQVTSAACTRAHSTCASCAQPGRVRARTHSCYAAPCVLVHTVCISSTWAAPPVYAYARALHGDTAAHAPRCYYYPCPRVGCCCTCTPRVVATAWVPWPMPGLCLAPCRGLCLTRAVACAWLMPWPGWVVCKAPVLCPFVSRTITCSSDHIFWRFKIR